MGQHSWHYSINQRYYPRARVFIIDAHTSLSSFILPAEQDTCTITSAKKLKNSAAMTTKVRYSRKENFSPKEQTKFSKSNEELRDYSIKYLVWSDGAENMNIICGCWSACEKYFWHQEDLLLKVANSVSVVKTIILVTVLVGSRGHVVRVRFNVCSRLDGLTSLWRGLCWKAPELEAPNALLKLTGMRHHSLWCGCHFSGQPHISCEKLIIRQQTQTGYFEDVQVTLALE